MKKRTRASLLIIAGFIGVGLWYFLTEDYGVDVDSVGWLPPEAHNITYLRNDLYAIAEFDIEQEVFENWCAGRRMPLRELGTGGYHAISRCVALLERRGVIPLITEANEAEANRHQIERGGKVFRAGDLFYEDRWPNGGGYCLGYDAQEKRGYYYFARH